MFIEIKWQIWKLGDLWSEKKIPIILSGHQKGPGPFFFTQRFLTPNYF
jgi:hypothetical protein